MQIKVKLCVVKFNHNQKTKVPGPVKLLNSFLKLLHLRRSSVDWQFAVSCSSLQSLINFYWRNIENMGVFDWTNLKRLMIG